MKKKLFTKYLELVNDIDTPVSVFNKISSRFKDSFLFESVLKGEQVGRYSFIGFNALKTISSHKVLELLRKEISNLEDDSEEELGFFYKGFVGFFPFETFCEIEPSVKPKVEEKAFAYLVGNLIVFDHVQQKLYLIQNSLEENFDSNLKEIELIVNDAKQPERLDFDVQAARNHNFEETGFYSNTGETEFKILIDKAKQHIFEGNVFQMVLSHKFLKDFKSKKLDPFLLYRILRTVNPSPYQFLFNYDDEGEIKTLVGSSPEMMTKSVKENSAKDGSSQIKAQISPIAGTYRRTHDVKKDEELKRKLLSDEKELAEHVMLIDLARNDLSRVCDDIQVPEKIFVETYSHVFHIVSNVTGILRAKSKSDSVIDLVKAAFPAGTLSGTPKIEAIKLILELEKESRGYYGGAIGYFGLNGTLDTAIMIRTMLITNDRLCIQAGCGVVADSDPESEWQETFNKANALIDVVLIAEEISS